jgi:hypothetical protein
MRLSDWRGRAPHKDALTAKVQAVIEPVLSSLGAAPDPSCWIAWGDDPSVRYTILAPTPPGLLVVHVRVNVPQEGPRAGGKLVRWNRVQIGELALEMAGGHRLLSFQVESQVLRGSDAAADGIAAFALELYAAIDGRAYTAPKVKALRKARTTKPAAKPRSPAKPAAPARPAAPPKPRSG